MKIEFTVQQLKKLMAWVSDDTVSSALGLRAYFYLLEKKNGVDDYDEQYQNLLDHKLAKKIGGKVYLTVSIDGEKPLQTTPQVAKRRGVVDSMGSFASLWNKLGGDPIIASEYNLLQKFVNTMTMPQFITLVEKFMAEFNGFKSVRNLWNNKETFSAD